MRFEVIEEPEVPGYAVLDTVSGEVVFRAAKKKECQDLADKGNAL